VYRVTLDKFLSVISRYNIYINCFTIRTIGVRIPEWLGIFLFDTALRPVLGPAQHRHINGTMFLYHIILYFRKNNVANLLFSTTLSHRVAVPKLF
jgi:hypothetical protein